MFLTYIDDVCLFVSFYKKNWLCLIRFFSLVYFYLVFVCFAFFVLVLFFLLCFLCVFWVSIVLFDFSLFMFVCFVVGEIDSMWTYFNPWRDLTHPHSLCQSHSSLSGFLCFMLSAVSLHIEQASSLLWKFISAHLVLCGSGLFLSCSQAPCWFLPMGRKMSPFSTQTPLIIFTPVRDMTQDFS